MELGGIEIQELDTAGDETSHQNTSAAANQEGFERA